jgi:hypothetical protein
MDCPDSGEKRMIGIVANVSYPSSSYAAKDYDESAASDTKEDDSISERVASPEKDIISIGQAGTLFDAAPKRKKSERIYKAIDMPDGSKVLQIVTITDGKTSIATQRLPKFSILRTKAGRTMRVINLGAQNLGGSAAGQSEFIF